MLFNYFKLALRLMARSPFFTIINVAGLTIGFAVFFILWPYTQVELESDQFIKDHEKIARVVSLGEWSDDGGKTWRRNRVSLAPSYASIEIASFANVISTTRFVSQDQFQDAFTPALYTNMVANQEQSGRVVAKRKVERAIVADKNFLAFFDLPMLYGVSETALQNANAVVISQHISRFFFADRDPLGTNLIVNGHAFLITGVFKDVPANSHLQFDWVFSNESRLSNWNEVNTIFTHHYVKFNGSPSALEAFINQRKEAIVGAFLRQNSDTRIMYHLQPLAEIVFGDGYLSDVFKPKSKLVVKALAAVSIIVIVMAWINYMNLTLATTYARYKEISIRKLNGARLQDLFWQFFIQCGALNLIAISIAFTIIQLVRAPMASIINVTTVSISELDRSTLAIFFLVLIAAIVVMAAYPAWMILRRPIHQALSRNLPGNNHVTISIFTTVQYAIAVWLIIWIFVIHNQLDFILNKDLGIDQDEVVVVEAPVLPVGDHAVQRMTTFLKHLGNVPGIQQATLSGNVCGEPSAIYSLLRKSGTSVGFGMGSHGGVDENYVPLFGLRLLAGRNFISDEQGTAVIISRVASERLGFESPQSAIGAMIEHKLWEEPAWTKLEVIGVIEDYRITPFNSGGEDPDTELNGEGLFLTYLNSVIKISIPARISLKVDAGNINELIPRVEYEFGRRFPDNVFQWYFLHDHVARQYGDQKVGRNQLMLFTIVALSIACLGLLAMISNKVFQKTKEISVRRILGASYGHVIAILLRSTGVQVCMSLLIGFPIAWKLSNDYLENYSHHITLHWWHFTLPVVMLMLIMFSTIAGVLLRTARRNPVDALKQE